MLMLPKGMTCPLVTYKIHLCKLEKDTPSLKTLDCHLLGSFQIKRTNLPVAALAHRVPVLSGRML
jgi:hypothetical protein